MTELEKEIKRYNIISLTGVRATGSQYGKHPYRCLWDLCGKPLIQWMIEAVQGSKYIDKVVVATEDRKIADVVEKLGATVVIKPFWMSLDIPHRYSLNKFAEKKPRSLRAKDSSIHTSAGWYILSYLEELESYDPDIFLLASANEPLGTAETADRLIEAFFKDKEASEAICLYPVDGYLHLINPKTNRPVELFGEWSTDHQLKIPLYRPGAFRVCGSPAIMASGGLKKVHIMVPEEEGADIHNREDLFKAGCYMRRRLEREASKEVK